MLRRKNDLIWLLMAMAITSFFIVSGFIFYNWNLQNDFEQVSVPVMGMLGDSPSFEFTIEGEKAEEFLNRPLSVVSANNKVYVTDSRNNRINVYNKRGKYLFSFGQMGLKEGEFKYPNTLAVDSDGNIYVGEFQNSRIQVFSSRGRFLKTVRPDKKVISPLAITISEDRLYLVNKDSSVDILSIDGELIKSFGKFGREEGSLSFPNGIVVSKDGRIFISDSGNNRIQIFNSDGKFVESFYGDNGSMLNLPRGLALDEAGRLYITDTFNHNISVYDEKFKFLFTIGNRGIGEGEFNFPNEVFVDEDFRVYVTDRENNRISVFSY